MLKAVSMFSSDSWKLSKGPFIISRHAETSKLSSPSTLHFLTGFLTSCLSEKRRQERKKLVQNILLTSLDLDFGFQTFRAGSREEISCRIRIRNEKH